MENIRLVLVDYGDSIVGQKTPRVVLSTHCGASLQLEKQRLEDGIARERCEYT